MRGAMRVMAVALVLGAIAGGRYADARDVGSQNESVPASERCAANSVHKNGPLGTGHGWDPGNVVCDGPEGSCFSN
jgi:hypothetical protein